MARRKCTKFIPDSDSDFACMARNFASAIARDPARYFVSQEESAAITLAITKFREALTSTRNPVGRNAISITRKDHARAEAEKIVRRVGTRIRANDAISATARIAARVKVRSEKLKKKACPRIAPVLQFRGEGNKHTFGYKVHRLRFFEEPGGEFISRFRGKGNNRVRGRAKPEGAARLELFIEFVAQGESLPQHPGELSGGRPWYLRSYTSNPMEVLFPIPTTPMLVCYWARWADTRGNVGPFSETLVTQIEGWMPGMALPGKSKSIDPKRMEAARARNGKFLTQHIELGQLNALEDAPPQKRLPDAA